MTIKELRTAVGMTQKALSEYIHCSIRTIQDWESGKRNAPIYVLELIEYKLKNEASLGNLKFAEIKGENK